MRTPPAGSAGRWLQRAGAMVLVLLAASAVWGRLVGVPQGVKALLVQEFAWRGLEIEIGKLTIDPLGGLVARELVIFRDGSRKIEQLRLAQVELSLNWWGWKEGEPILAGAELRNGNVDWPLGEQVKMTARRVEAVLEFRPGEILLKRGRGQILGFDLQLEGRVGLEAGREIPPPNELWGKVWGDMEKALGELGGPAPRMQAEFEVEVGKLEESKAKILLTGADNVWRGVALKKIEVKATVGEGMIRLEKFEIGLEKGCVQMNGFMDLKESKGDLEYFSNASLEQFAAVGGERTRGLKGWKSTQPPMMAGKIEFDWKKGSQFLWQGRLEVGEFRSGEASYERLVVPWVTDGKRWMMQGLKIEGKKGRLDLQLGFDGKAELKGDFKSDLELAGLKPWLGEGALPFWESLELRVNPRISGQITGAAWEADLIRVEGKVEVEKLAYKKVEMDELAGKVILAAGQLTVKDLQVRAAGGEGTGEFIYGFAPEKVKFTQARSTLPIQEFSRVFGAKFEKTMKPYHFQGRPTVVLEGEVDLEEKGGSNLRTTVVAPGGMKYKVAGKELQFTEMEMVVEVLGRKVIVRTEKNRPAKVLGGKIELRVEVDGAEKKQMTEITKITGVDFAQLVKTYFDFEGYEGKFSGKAKLGGPTENWREWSGAGRLLVDEGVLPGMGAFASAMNAPAEWVGLTDENADMDFELAKGKLAVKKLNIESTLVVTTGQGVYDIANDRLEDFSMRQNLRGPAGVPFFLVSQMFQYEGSGSLKNPVWKPKSFEDEAK